MPMCKGKKRFATQHKAERILNIAWNRAIYGATRGQLPCRSYKCYKCNGWHLTSKGKAGVYDRG